MGILNRLFGTANKPSANEFPPEGKEGTVKIKDQQIIYKNNHLNRDDRANLSDLCYVYLVADQKTSLVLSDGRQHYIPSDYKGFGEVYRSLSAKFGFDDEVFFSYLPKKGSYRQQLWRKINTQNYGFADQDHAQTFDLKDIKSFSIENMLPAKGGGEGYLNIQLRKGKTNICILRGAAPHSIDWLAERLTELSGKTVTFDPEYYNC